MDQKTRKTIAASLRAAATKLQAAPVKAALTSEDRAMIKDATIQALNEVLTNRRVLQDLNERVNFPDQFNDGDQLAAITKVAVDDGKLEITLRVGDEKVIFSL